MVIKTTNNNNTQLIVKKLAESFERLGFFQENYHQESLDSIKQFILFREKLKSKTQGQKVLLQKSTTTVLAPVQSTMALLKNGLVSNFHSYCSSMLQLNDLARSNQFSELLKKELTDEVLEALVLSENDKTFYTTIAVCFYQSLKLYVLGNSETFREKFDEFLQSIGVYDETTPENNNAFELKEYSIKELIAESVLEGLVEEGYYSNETIDKATVSLPKDFDKFITTFINYSSPFKKGCLQELYGDTLQFNELMIMLLALNRSRYYKQQSPKTLLKDSCFGAITMLECVDSKLLEFNDNPGIETLVNKLVLFKTYTIDQVLSIIEGVIKGRNKPESINQNLQELIIIQTIISLILTEYKFDLKSQRLKELNKHYNEFFWLKLYPSLIETHSVALQELTPCLENFMDYSIKNNELTIHELYYNKALVNYYYNDDKRIELFCKGIKKQYPLVERVVFDKNNNSLPHRIKKLIQKDFGYKYLLIHSLKNYKEAEQLSVRILYKGIKADLLNYKRFQLLLSAKERDYVHESLKLLKDSLDELEGIVLGLSTINFDYKNDYKAKVDYHHLKQEVVELLSEY